MYATLVLAMSMASQCGPSGCPRPAVINVPVAQVVPTRPPVQVPVKRTVRYKGVYFVAEGFMTPQGTLLWYADSPFNRKALAEAQAVGDNAKPPFWFSDPANFAKPPKPVMLFQDFGVEHGKMGNNYKASPESKKYEQEATAAAGAAPKLHLTVIGDQAARDSVLNDVANHPAFANLKDRLSVQGYKPGDWAVDPSIGFRSDGKPGIVVQQSKGPWDAKGGRVVYRANDYSMGPDSLAASIRSELRRIDPTYNPALDPGPGNPAEAGGFSGDNVAFVIAVVVAALFVVKLPRSGE